MVPLPLQQARERYEALNTQGRAMVWASGAVVVVLGCYLLNVKTPEPAKPHVKPSTARADVKKDASGYFLGEDIDHKAYVGRLEAQYYSVAEKNKAMALRLDDLTGKLNDVLKAEGRMAESLSALERGLGAVSTKLAGPVPVAGQMDAQAVTAAAVRNYQLDVININPVKATAEGTVYLPAGSFVRATLLTGVYAPAETGNPLPVLIRLDEAFYGPNDARIPLAGAFAIGKSTGELNSERALVQISTISSVLPTGETFEHKGNIGYLTDAGGQLGLKGIVVRNTGGQMAMAFMTGFMGGASQAMADAQTTATVGGYGRVSRNVTGSPVKNAGFQGLAQSAAQMSKYYEDQLGKIVPAVKVDAGVDVYLIILEGVEIHGLKKDSLRPADFVD